MDIQTKTIQLFDKIVNDVEISKKLEQGIRIYMNNTEEVSSENIHEYTILANKIYTNLKNDYVLQNIKNNRWEPCEIAEYSRETMNPIFWQKIQDERLPKSSKEKVKGLYKCKRCKSWYTTHSQKQTRSADEGMTTFVTCSECEFLFKIS